MTGPDEILGRTVWMYATDSRVSSLARASGYGVQRSEGKASDGSEAAQRDNGAERCGDAGEIIIILEEGGQQADCAICYVDWVPCNTRWTT
jgi:hypothetical protein